MSKLIERLRNEWVPIAKAALDSDEVTPLHASNCMAALFDIQKLQADEIERLRGALITGASLLEQGCNAEDMAASMRRAAARQNPDEPAQTPA